MADKLFGISLADQRIKWLLVAGLAAVLMAVILWGNGTPPAGAGGTGTAGARQRATASGPSASAADKAAFPPSGKGGQGVASHPSAPLSSTEKTVEKATGNKSRSRRNVAATSADELEIALKFDPFAIRPALQPQLAGQTAHADQSSEQAQKELAEKNRAEAVQQRLSEFRGQKVRVLLRNPNGEAAALIGSKLVHEGDVLDGVRVLSISTDGVVLEAEKK